MRPTALEALFGGQNCSAYFWTLSLNSSLFADSQMWFTMPSCWPRSKSKVSPVTISSIATLLLTSRASRWVPPVPGSTPSVTSGSPILPAPLRAMRMSAAIAISSPPPTVWPFKPAITSLGVCSRRFKYLKVGFTVLSMLMLAPAQKNFSPAPRITITCTASSKRACRMASSRSRIIS